MAADNDINAAIASETARATAAESANTSNNAEQARAEGKEAQLSSEPLLKLFVLKLLKLLSSPFLLRFLAFNPLRLSMLMQLLLRLLAPLCRSQP